MVQLLRILRTIHGWVGVIVVPWVLIYGLTGFYLNHEGGFAFLLGGNVDTLWTEDAPARLTSEDEARAWMAAAYPGLSVRKVVAELYHDRPAYTITTDGATIVAPKNSTSYFEKTRYQRMLHAADGRIVDTHIYWPQILKELHTHGWLRSPAGTTVADVFSLLLIGFGVTGACLWTIPRLMRMRARRATSRRPA